MIRCCFYVYLFINYFGVCVCLARGEGVDKSKKFMQVLLMVVKGMPKMCLVERYNSCTSHLTR